MKPNKNVQRNTVNENAVKFSEVQKSGFSLGYSSQTSGSIGKLLPLSTQYLMPGDKCSGGNSLRVQFEPLAVPMTGRLSLDMHNFYVKLRNIYGEDFTNFMSMSQGVSEIENLPTWSMKQLFEYFESLQSSFPSWPAWSPGAYTQFIDYVNDWIGTGVSELVDFTTEDWLTEYRNAILSYIRTAPIPSSEDDYKSAVKTIMYLVCDKLVGEGSYLDYFGYPILDHRSINRLVDAGGFASTDWKNAVSDLPLNDVPLRAFYYIWYVYYRNIYTEPKKNCINPRKWSATPLPMSVLSMLIVPRFRNWNIDIFTGAQIDDISRHVYMGVPNDTMAYQYEGASDSYEPVDSSIVFEKMSEGIVSQNLHYLDNDGTTKVITVPVPSMFGSAALQSSVLQNNQVTVPLLQLRRAKMLERFLKRVFYGGDLYTDFMQSIYGVNLSDAIANQPQFLFGSSTSVDVSQEVNNTSTQEMPAGTKTAVMSAEGNGDGFQFFADEFGVYINVVSFLPECSYDAMPNQLLYSKLMDFPIPQFTQQDDELSHRFELSRFALKADQDAAMKPFAHHPYKHDWRGRVNEFHGNALSTRKMYNFGRLFDYSSDSTTPKLNASFMHCKPNLDMFIVNNPLNDVWFGYADHQFYVERALSAYVEEI